MSSSELSEYEKRRLDNLKENQRILEKMGIFSKINDMEEIYKPKKPIIKTINIVKKAKKTSDFLLPLTRSKRRNSTSDVDQNFTSNSLVYSQNQIKYDEKAFEPIKEVEIKCHSLLYEKNKKTQNSEHSNVHKSTNKILNFKTNDLQIFKVIESRITAMICHRTGIENFMAFIGDKFGNLSIFHTFDIKNVSNLNEETYKIEQFDVHNESINTLQVTNKNIAHVISASFDQTIRLFDFEKMKNILMCDMNQFNVVGKLSTVKHCEINGFCLYGTSKGNIGQIDIRSNKISSVYIIGKRRVYNFSQHPTDENMICISNSNEIDLYDLRQLNKPIKNLISSTKAISSCEFSEGSGNCIAVLGYDDFIATFDFGPSGCDMIKKIYHNNNTGRWLSRFRCQWMPKSDTNFVTGSIEYPRRIDVFSRDCELVQEIGKNDLNYVCSINSFHHDGKVLISGNSSGKMTILQDV